MAQPQCAPDFDRTQWRRGRNDGEEEGNDENSISDESDTPHPEVIESNIDEDEDLPV